AGYGPNGRVCALTTSHAHHRMTTVREGASLEASTASPAAGAAGAAGAIVAALARAGARLVFGVPGGGPNLDVVGAADAAGEAVAAKAVGIARAAPAGPVIANMQDGAADQHGPVRVQNGIESQTLRAAEDAAARAGRAILAEAVREARRPVVLLGTGAIPRTAAVRDAQGGRGIPALHTYRARGVLPDSGAEAAGLVTGGTMERPLLSAADLIVGLGVDEAEMISARWDLAART